MITQGDCLRRRGALAVSPWVIAVFGLVVHSSAGAQSRPSASPQAAAPAQRPTVVPVEVRINDLPTGPWLLLRQGDQYFAPQDALDAWRIGVRPPRSLNHAGSRWFALADLPGYTARLNEADQVLSLGFDATAFVAVELGRTAARPKISHEVLPMGFMSYDISATVAQAGPSDILHQVGLLTEIGHSSPWGVFSSSFVGRALGRSGAETLSSVRRLESSFSRDFLDQQISLRLGDSATRSTATGRALFYGGVQIGRNFNLTPGLVRQPLPTLVGSSASPATLQLFVNNVLQQTTSVAPGPFSLSNVPVTAGAGEVRLVVRDLLGRETVVRQDFVNHPLLLKPGLSDWTVEAGALREALGVEDAAYGERFVSGYYRRGWLPWLTLEQRLTLSESSITVGGAAALPLPLNSLAQATALLSRDRAGSTGMRWAFDFERAVDRHTVFARLEHSSDGYRELGFSPLIRPRASGALSYAYGHPRFGNISLSLAGVQDARGTTTASQTAAYSRRLGELGNLSLNWTRFDGGLIGGVNQAVFIIFAGQIGKKVSATASAFHRTGGLDTYASFAPLNFAADRWTWRGNLGRAGEQAFADAGMSYAGSTWTGSADVSIGERRNGLRLGAQGGAVLVGGRAFATRSTTDSVALVEVPRLPDVGVRQDGRLPVYTDQQGLAVISGLQPFVPNRIAVEASDVPLSVEMDTLELTVVPPARSAVKATFAVRTGRSVMLRLVFDDGGPVPLSAVLKVKGDDREFFVAHRGESYLTGMSDTFTFQVSWKGQTCDMSVQLKPAGGDELTRVGPVLCKGVKR